MKPINIRYGSSVELSIEADEEGAATATLFIGRVGEAPIVTVPATFDEGGEAYLELTTADSEKLVVGSYSYQVNVTYTNGKVKKFPEPDTCDNDELPEFIVSEALDATGAGNV